MGREGVRVDRIAEDEVANLCRAAGGTVQKAKEDDHGWDLMVEFPPRTQSAFADVEEPIRRCFIQVKSTTSRTPTTRVKLSNALKFAKENLPCFTVLLTYPNGRTRLEAAYIRHFWTADMGEALKKARQATVDGRKLNKVNVDIRFGRAERADEALIDALMNAIDRIGPNYPGTKRRLAGSLGYEDGWGTADIMLPKGHGYRDLEDLLLGIRKDLPIAEFISIDRRFGIPGPIEKTGPGTLSMDLQPTARCAVSLQRRDSGEEISWPGALFIAHLDFVPINERRMRIVAGPLEFVISGAGSIEAKWSAPLDAALPLEDLERIATFRSWMDGESLDFSVWSERGSLAPTKLSFNGKPEEHWADALAAIRALSSVIPPERRPHSMKLSMQELLKNIEQHSMLAALSSQNLCAVRVVGQKPWSDELDTASHIVFPMVNRVADHFLVSVIERDVLSISRVGDRLDMTTSAGKILRGTALKASEASDEVLAAEVRWAKERARQSQKRIMSFHPTGGGMGDLEMTWEDDDDLATPL